ADQLFPFVRTIRLACQTGTVERTNASRPARYTYPAPRHQMWLIDDQFEPQVQPMQLVGASLLAADTPAGGARPRLRLVVAPVLDSILTPILVVSVPHYRSRETCPAVQW